MEISTQNDSYPAFYAGRYTTEAAVGRLSGQIVHFRKADKYTGSHHASKHSSMEGHAM